MLKNKLSVIDGLTEMNKLSDSDRYERGNTLEKIKELETL